MTKHLLTLVEAAAHLDMTPEALMLSRARALPPGILGFKERRGGPLVWHVDDLLPAPRAKLEKMAGMVEAIADATHQCIECGFQAKSKGGLATHRRRHG